MRRKRPWLLAVLAALLALAPKETAMQSASFSFDWFDEAADAEDFLRKTYAAGASLEDLVAMVRDAGADCSTKLEIRGRETVWCRHAPAGFLVGLAWVVTIGISDDKAIESIEVRKWYTGS